MALALGVALQVATLAPAAAHGSASQFYAQHNLVADASDPAHIDGHLVNAWGLAHGPTGPWWVADNSKGVATLYNGAGVLFSPIVTIPAPGSGASAPTAVVFNATRSFVIAKGHVSGAATFLFATEDGTIAGWNDKVDATHAILAVNNAKASAVYKGLALGSVGSVHYLYATNFRAGRVEVFNARFARVTLAGHFADSHIPTGFSPFGIRTIGGRLYVTYVKQDAAKHDDVKGLGNGFVDVFGTDGVLLQRLAARGTLDSPWGLDLAPNDFGRFSNALLVGNFGNGRINAFNPRTGAFLGQFEDRASHALAIDGLWGLDFGNDHTAGSDDRLFFTAGPAGEQHGLFGYLVPR
jgi:uncharacterized protein (TIGR03118 family)